MLGRICRCLCFTILPWRDARLSTLSALLLYETLRSMNCEHSRERWSVCLRPEGAVLNRQIEPHGFRQATTAKFARGRQATSLPTALRVCPICALQRAGVSRGISEPFVWHVGDVDQRIRGNWATRRWESKQVSGNLVSDHKINVPLIGPRRPPRSRHGNAISLSGLYPIVA
jgi:hypothetical protein